VATIVLVALVEVCLEVANYANHDGDDAHAPDAAPVGVAKHQWWQWRALLSCEASLS